LPPFKVTRLEVEIGMLQRADRDKKLKTFAFFREIENIPSKNADEFIKDFSEKDEKNKELVENLKKDAKSDLDEKNQFSFQV
jgi:hypothetical protein